MKKMQRKGFTLVELIIVIVVIGILAGMAAPKFMGVVRDARHANFINDVDVLTTVATLVETTRDQDAPVYGYDATQNAVTFAQGADIVNALHDSGYLDEYYTNNGIDPTTATDADKKAAADALEIRPIDVAKYKKNLGKNVKTGDLSNYFVITKGSNAGTIVYINDGGDGSAIGTTTDFTGVVDGEGDEYFGLDIVNKAN